MFDKGHQLRALAYLLPAVVAASHGIGSSRQGSGTCLCGPGGKTRKEKRAKAKAKRQAIKRARKRHD